MGAGPAKKALIVKNAKAHNYYERGYYQDFKRSDWNGSFAKIMRQNLLLSSCVFTFLVNAICFPVGIKQHNRISSLQKKIEVLEKEIKRLEQFGGVRGSYSPQATCEGRLTTQSGTAISTSDQSSKSTIYFTTYHGSVIGLYSGSWTLTRFTELSLALSGLTSDTNYDVFVYSNSGTATLELSAAWASDTARTDALALQDGVLVKSGTPTRRYLGTIRTTSTTTTEDSHSKRFVWNYCNRVFRHQYVNESTSSWAYATDAWRSTNGNASNKVEFVIGVNESLVTSDVMSLIKGSTTGINYVAAGVGLDSSTVNAAYVYGSSADSGAMLQMWATYEGFPGIGYHYLQWLERGNATSTTFYGTNGDATHYASGLISYFEG